MANGPHKPSVERVKASVLTRDQNDDANGKVVAKRVLSTSIREAPATVTVTLATGEKIDCTPEHPFYVEGKGFVEAKDLGIGTSIVTRAGPAVQVASVQRHNAPATVYNFVVEDTHTYFAGAANGGVEVHNGPCAIPGRNNFAGPDGPQNAFAHMDEFHGIDPNVASDRLHVLKADGGLGPADDVVIGRTGDVYNAGTGDHLGKLTDKGLGGK